MSENTKQKSVEEVKREMPDENTVYDLAELFKIFGDSTRMKILSCLEASSLVVGDIAEALGMSVSAVSHQLRILKSAKLVKSEKKGKEALYSLDDDHVSAIIDCGLSHLGEGK